MLGPFDYAVWLIALFGQVFVLACSARNREFRLYLSLNLYVLALAVRDVASFFVLQKYSVSSPQYYYYYFSSDLILRLLHFVAIIGLYLHAFRDANTAKRVRFFAVAVIGAIILYSGFILERKHQLLVTPFVITFSGMLFFVGALITMVLWIILLKRRDPRLRLVLIVSAFGVYFSVNVFAYGLEYLFPRATPWYYIPPTTGALFALALSHAFAYVPGEVRIPATALKGII